jgi:hypothetical protein
LSEPFASNKTSFITPTPDPDRSALLELDAAGEDSPRCFDIVAAVVAVVAVVGAVLPASSAFRCAFVRHV